MQSNNINFENSIGPWMGKTVKIVEYYLQEGFQNANLDLTKEQMIVLKKLSEEDGLSQNKLARLTFRDKSSLARLLAKMELKKYIYRKQSEEDKRTNEVFITKEGASVFRKTRPVIQKIIDIMERDITKEEKELMIKILKKVQFNFTAKAVSL